MGRRMLLSSIMTAMDISTFSFRTTFNSISRRVPKPGENVNCNWKGLPVNCGPRGLPPGFPSSHVLYHNNGDGTFTNVTAKAGIGGPRQNYGMTVVAADFDEDGWPDIYVACDSTPSLLFMNNHDGTFREEGVLRGVAFNDDGMEQAGMGVGVGDFNLDGHLDLIKTNFSEDTCVLYQNDGKGRFSGRDANQPTQHRIKLHLLGNGDRGFG